MTPDEMAAFVNQYVANTKAKLAEFERVFLTLFVEDLVAETPVQTGQLRGSWGLSIGPVAITHTPKLEPGAGVRHSPSPETEARLGRIISTIRAPVEKVNFYNLAPYAMKVEYGTSNFAPRAYIRATLGRVDSIVVEAASRVS